MNNLLASSGINIEGVKVKASSAPEERLARFRRNPYLMKCLQSMQDTVDYDVPDVIPKLEPYRDVLRRMVNQNTELVTTREQKSTIEIILRTVSSGDDDGSESSAANNSLGSEMTREREREQEQEQQKEQEKEQDNAFARDDREQIKWSSSVLERSRANDVISRSARDGEDRPFLQLRNFSPRPSDFRYRGADGRNRIIEKVDPLSFPQTVLQSTNFAPPYAQERTSSIQPVRLRNAMIVLEWKPRRDEAQTIAVTMSEAEGLRLYLHSNRVSGRSGSSSLRLIALRARRVLESSDGGDIDEKQNKALTGSSDALCLRFYDSQMYFEDEELKTLLESLRSTSALERRRLFEASLAARRRGRGTWLGTPVRLCFLFDDGLTLGRLQGLVRQIRDAVESSSTSLEDVCEKCDRNSDGYLDRTELSNALRSLVSSVGGSDLTELIKLIDVNSDNAINYVEFCNIFSVPESSSTSTRVDVVNDETTYEDEEEDDFEDEEEDDFEDEEDLLMPEDDTWKGDVDDDDDEMLLRPEDDPF